MDENKSHGWGRFFLLLFVLGVLDVILLFVMRSQAVCDLFVQKAVPALTNTVGSVTGKTAVPVTEVCMTVLAALLLLTVLLLILLIFLRKRKGYRALIRYLVRFWLLFAVLMTGRLIIFQSAITYSTPVIQPQPHDFADLTAMWNYTVRQVNTLGQKAERDENHHLVRRSEEEIRAAIRQAGEKLSDSYTHDFAEPTVQKTSLFSAAVHQFGIGAYYVEPWHETIFTVTIQNKSTYPCVCAHEYSHSCGYYREDEANFMSIMLCINSGDVNTEYLAWLDFMYDLWDAVEKAYFGDEPVNEDDPEYLAYCDALEPYFDYPLIAGDYSGNYRWYHKTHGEEAVVDEREQEKPLSEETAALIQQQGKKHFENLRAHLGSHYYDGVVQLMLDRFAEEYRAEASG